LQFDLWHKEFVTLRDLGMLDQTVRQESDDKPVDPSSFQQKPFVLSNDEIIQPTWESLKEFIIKYGLRNAHVTCQQPTATTSLINNNCEMKEAPTRNIYTRELMGKEFTLLNTHLERDLRAIGLWNSNTVNYIISTGGSVAGLDKLVLGNPNLFPNFDRLNLSRLLFLITKYKTMYEIKNRTMLKLTADSGRYICQSQSTNLYFDSPDINKIKGAFYLASKLGLKTTSYYTRIPSYTLPSFINTEVVPSNSSVKKLVTTCTDDYCTSCGQ